MKKAYILITLVFLISFLGFWLSLNTTISSYTPRFIRDSYYYLQAQILIDEKLAKYLLYKAKLENKECLNSITLNYPNPNDKIKIDYYYPIAQCQNFKLVSINQDANLSKDGVIIVHISVALNSQKGVNDEILINKTFILQAKESFWLKK
ncbi:hypothetical protein [Campylobacter estrildidarum]|uniref:Periplasmic protein n=1 Tax=Campylobacter estrildidarum TaxID=2510189 RepID=A0A4U7BSI0_9BACT|nr:hypothetical protein [Campylobacter estrildidarum]TKX31734.1 hypothetical protein CQA69_01515 [Campylobacter estrildidarum]